MDLGAILNQETPRDVPLRPMGRIPVIVRLVLTDRQETSSSAVDVLRPAWAAHRLDL